MNCPSIDNIAFSSSSLDSIEQIRDYKLASNRLIHAIGWGHLASIFVGNGLVEATYSLVASDFEGLAKDMKKIPEITRQQIYKTAVMTELRVSNYKEKLFWRAVADGCTMQ